MIESHRKYNELKQQTATGIHVHNLNNKIADLEFRIRVLESKINSILETKP